MKFYDDILKELHALSPLLAGLPKTNVFKVPEGYFETVSATVLICIKEEAGLATDKKNTDLPKGYFKNLPSSILDKIKLHQANITTTDFESNALLFPGLQRTNVFEVPGKYFDNLSSIILGKIKDTQHNIDDVGPIELSALMQSLQHTNVFEVTSDYFNSVPTNVLKKVITTPAKVVGLFKIRSLLKYAAAAIITGAMALGVYKYMVNPSAINQAPVVGFATLDSSIEKGRDMNQQQFNEALNNLTKEDITNYLEKNGSDIDMALVTPNVNESDLPNRDDYLLDENTLENYLDKIKFKN
jgi:hypothetical protein